MPSFGKESSIFLKENWIYFSHQKIIIIGRYSRCTDRIPEYIYFKFLLLLFTIIFSKQNI